MVARQTIQRRTTTSSTISTVGESLMSQLPLEQGKRATAKFVDKTNRRRLNDLQHASPSPPRSCDSRGCNETSANHHRTRVTDSDYDSGTEYAASTRVKVRPMSYM